MGKETCWTCKKVKNDVELRATEDRMCEYCYSKNEEALGALAAFSVSDDMRLSPDTPSNRVANTENVDDVMRLKGNNHYSEVCTGRVALWTCLAVRQAEHLFGLTT